jgi:hypothetical protein
MRILLTSFCAVSELLKTNPIPAAVNSEAQARSTEDVITATPRTLLSSSF